jgi:hypothetical protein
MNGENRPCFIEGEKYYQMKENPLSLLCEFNTEHTLEDWKMFFKKITKKNKK